MKRVLALDGGHTRTRAVVLDEAGTVLAQAVAGPVAPYYGPEELQRALDQVGAAVRGCLNQLSGHSRFDAICCGMTTGGENSPFTAPLRELIGSLGIGSRLSVREDFEMSLIAASGGAEHGVVVIAGGGSIAYGCHGGQRVRSGGWGTFFGDEGSALSIGRMALNAVARSLDGRDELTSLSEAILRHFDEPRFRQVTRRVFAGSLTQTDVADLTPLVADCAVRGDRTARRILHWAADELALIAATVVHRLAPEEAIAVYPTGGVFREARVLLPAFGRAVRKRAPQAQVTPALYPPIFGAVIEALREAGIEPHPAVLERAASRLRAAESTPAGHGEVVTRA